ncbi:Cation channel sperm-associated protein subunit beta [Amphibalanus amphitrite]|uniref:Cation channel sperm-associated protein subunit beta n=1 Tax=Amphibalanus amphitrite TaxID=1232801 RepID=A0A6A4UZX6_AMPAM|nr:Cation channel sperm-associated protein subunit beta [Amphibalanus amphitrite]
MSNTTLLAQLAPIRGQTEASISRLTEHFFWVGAAPHLALTNVNRTVDVPFAMELYRRGAMVAWRCHFARSHLNEDLADINGGQWNGEVSLSRGSGFFATRVSLTDLRFVGWSAWPWGGAVSAATVAPRVGRLRYLQDPCGGDIGLLVSLSAPGRPGLLAATVVGTNVTWYDLSQMDMVRGAFGGSPPSDLGLISATMTSAHLLLLTTHGLLVSPAFRGERAAARGARAGAFSLLKLQTDGDVSAESLAKDELIHSLSCFSSKEDNETVLLLLHSEHRYLLGRAPFHRRSSWRGLETLIPRPAALQSVTDIRYIWHRRAVFLGYDKGDTYETLVLPLSEQTSRTPSGERCEGDCETEPIRRPYVLLCPLTKKIYLMADKMFGSMVGGALFARPMSNTSFSRVEHCVTDLINHHICVTEQMELVVIGVGSNEPERIPLHEILPEMNITEAAKTALLMDRAGGVTVYGVASGGFGSYYFNLESGLPEKYDGSCDYYLELLGGLRHAGMIHLDVHDIITVEVEAGRVHGDANLSRVALDTDSIDVELSHPSVVHVERADSVRDAAVRLALTVRPNSWAVGAVCAVTFRLPAASALCSRTSRVVNLELSRHHHRVNYRPPSDLGINIPTSENIYNADPSQPLNQNLLIEHAISRDTGRFKACAGKSNRSECGCTEEQQYSTGVEHSDCRVYVPMMSWPAKLRLTMSIRGSHRPRRPLLAPTYVNITELNNRSSWENHILLGPDLARIYQRNLSARDRRLVDPQRIRILMKGTGLYHFRIQVAEHTSFGTDHDDVLVYVVPARLKSQVQNVVYPMVGITLIIILFVVFEYYHQRYADADDESETESDEDDDVVTGTPSTQGPAPPFPLRARR